VGLSAEPLHAWSCSNCIDDEPSAASAGSSAARIWSSDDDDDAAVGEESSSSESDSNVDATTSSSSYTSSSAASSSSSGSSSSGSDSDGLDDGDPIFDRLGRRRKRVEYNDATGGFSSDDGGHEERDARAAYQRNRGLDDGSEDQYMVRLARWREWMEERMAVLAAAAAAGDGEDDDADADDEEDERTAARELAAKQQQQLDADSSIFGDWGTVPDDAVFEGGFRVPGIVWQRMHLFQQTGVQFLYELHRQKCGGILGDEMGLGKTIQVIAFFTALHFGGRKQLDHARGHAFATPYQEHVGPGMNGAILIVCPATVVQGSIVL
jgi:DNA excision repair protein ERCC-6